MRHLLAGGLVALALGGAVPAFAQNSAAVPAAAPVPPVDSENLAVAQQIVNLAFPPTARQAMLMRMVNTLTDQMRSAETSTTRATPAATDPELQQILQRRSEREHAMAERVLTEDSPPLFTALARAYARTFTRDELLQIRAFVATPAGSAFLQRSAGMLSDPDVAEANRVYLSTVFSASRSLRTEFEQEMAQYAAHHRRR